MQKGYWPCRDDDDDDVGKRGGGRERGMAGPTLLWEARKQREGREMSAVSGCVKA
jgi:hypothetical protein